MLWLTIWPFALVIAIQSVILALTVFRPGHHAPHSSQAAPPTLVSLVVRALWYGSVAGEPGLSLFDATIYVGVAYLAVQRTRLVRTGLTAGAAVGIVGVGVLFSAAAAITPGLMLAVLQHPLLIMILFVHAALPFVYSLMWGVAGGLLAVATPERRRLTRSE